MRWLGSMCTRAAASQGEARQAGHRGECAAAARAGTRTAVKPTANQMRVSEILEQLAVAADWRGVDDRAGEGVACGKLGNTNYSLEDYSKALESRH
jgi:hypothetical protein